MDLTPILRAATEEQFEELLEAEGNSVRSALYLICRDGGCRLIESEMCPPGIVFGGEMKGLE